LPDTEAGVFARLVAQAALGGLEPVTLLALLKHARFRLARRRRARSRASRRSSLRVLRGPRPRAGTQGLRMRSQRSAPPRMRCTVRSRASGAGRRSRCRRRRW
jgi:inactivated superfamily I helicase